MDERKDLAIRVRGQVQGVGYRPFVWQLAQAHGVTGQVLNDPEGVLIFAKGASAAFLRALKEEAPPLARVDAVETAPHVFDAPPPAFLIAASEGVGARTRVTPDAATCADCLREIRDPANRRFGYAFANCTHCGPRLSILDRLPYDRARTSMAAFPMCVDCRAEYEDPTDRRFHAQPVACAACGPRVWLEADGVRIEEEAIAEAAVRLLEGQILAIKGIGGFHLACDANNAEAIARLRKRKARPTKPLAIMATLGMLRRHARATDAEIARLSSPAAPIVLLAKAGEGLPEGLLAPGQSTLGWMLPATPLHHLLFDRLDRPLVMTSGNRSGAPQVIGNDAARDALGTIADAFLLHDRDIRRRLDDSVERITPSGPMILRRGRGRVPGTLTLPPGFEAAPATLATGSDLKGAICMTKSGQALLSHHLGDLDEAQSFAEARTAITDYRDLFDHAPQLVAADLHKGYRATRLAETEAHGTGAPLTFVQHHHAHLAACLGEHLWPRNGGPVAGIILDGIGLGPDGTIWGGELLVGDYVRVTRAAWLRPVPLIGGDAASRQPWRNLLARLDDAGLPEIADARLATRPLATLRRASAHGVNAPLCSSAGRLFDAYAAYLGLAPDTQSFEGEAAMTLETAALAGSGTPAGPDLPVSAGEIDPAPLFRIAPDRADMAALAFGFHASLARAFADAARRAVEGGAARAVVLSGGCFQNALLLQLTLEALDGVPVLTHAQVPANDGGLAMGQALVAMAQNIDTAGC
jgi:hydrogenase maturation protein HypF